MKLLTIGLVVVVLSNDFVKAQSDVLVDARNGRQYKTVEIGKQVWMAQNLGFADSIYQLYTPYYYEHNTRIAIVTPKDIGTVPEYNLACMYCYRDKPINCKNYGMLYTWEAAQKACPTGWHLPSKREFEQLLLTVGGGEKKKTKQALTDGSFAAWNCGYLSANYNTDGFSFYSGLGVFAGFWTSTSKDTKNATYVDIQKQRASIIDEYKGNAYSVRCIKDSIR